MKLVQLSNDDTTMQVTMVVSRLEISCILTAYCLSFLLLLGTWRRGWYHDPNIELLWATIVTLSCFGVWIWSLVLGMSNKISLDAMSAASIGFIPAANNLRNISYKKLRARYLMWRRKSLHRLKGRAMYARVGPKHSEINGECSKKGTPCDLNLFIRKESGDYLTDFDKNFFYFFRPRRYDEEMRTSDFRQGWHGKEIGDCTRNGVVVVIKDKRNGDAFKFRNGIVRATEIVEFPPYAYMVSKFEALNALTAAADIVMIGDFILHFFEPNLKKYFESNNSISCARYRTPALVCNQLFKELKLETWGKISSDTTMPEFPESQQRGKQYGAIFFILAVRSKIFNEVVDPNMSAVDILEKCEKGDYENESKLKDDVRRWLFNYGFHFDHCSSRAKQG